MKFHQQCTATMVQRPSQTVRNPIWQKIVCLMLAFMFIIIIRPKAGPDDGLFRSRSVRPLYMAVNTKSLDAWVCAVAKVIYWGVLSTSRVMMPYQKISFGRKFIYEKLQFPIILLHVNKECNFLNP